MKQPSLADRKSRLKHRWAYGSQANDMPLATFARLMMALDKAHTHADLDKAAQAWKEAVAKQGAKT